VGLHHPLTDRYEICTQILYGVKAEDLYSINFVPTPKNLATEKPQFPQTFENGRQSEVCNFESAQHTNKQIADKCAKRRYKT